MLVLKNVLVHAVNLVLILVLDLVLMYVHLAVADVVLLVLDHVLMNAL